MALDLDRAEGDPLASALPGDPVAGATAVSARPGCPGASVADGDLPAVATQGDADGAPSLLGSVADVVDVALAVCLEDVDDPGRGWAGEAEADDDEEEAGKS